jgi:hypothetical protein
MSDLPITNDPIYKIMITDGRSIFPVSTIQYQSKFWFVPQWLVNDDQGWQTPAYIICPDNLQLQDLRGRGFPSDFGMNVPIPKSALDDLFQGKQVAGWTVIHRPPVRFPKQPSVH